MNLLANLCCGLNQTSVEIANAKPLDEKAIIGDSYLLASPPVNANSTTTSLLPSKETVLNAAKTALSLLHATLDSVPVPGLKGLIGGILFIMDAFDKADQTHDVFADLERNIVSLETLLSRYRDPTREIPPDIQNLVTELTLELEDVNVQIHQVVGRHRMRHIVNGSADAVLVIRLVSRVNWAVAKMTAGISLNSAHSAQRFEETGQKVFLDKIARAKDASWKHLDRPTCLPGTRVTLLDKITDWLNKDDTHQVFWLNGLAGTGKTTIAQSVADLAAKLGKLGASFFCSRDSSERSDHTLIFPTIAFQLAESDTRLGSKISDAVRDNLDIGSMRPDEQLKALILGPLKEQGSVRIPLLAVVDALDECRDPSAAEKILLALTRNGAFSLPFFKVFVTSRPISSIRTAFKDNILNPLSRVFVLHGMDSHGVDEDIRLFITTRLREAEEQRDRFTSPADWPPSSLIDKLVRKSSPFFIFASTACQYIAASGGDLEERLEEIANLPTSDYERSLGIDALYKRVFDTAFERFPDARTIIRCRSIVGTVILLQNPVAIPDLANLLELRVAAVSSILNELRSLLIVPEDINGPVRPFHASLHDFLTDRQRCPENLYINPSLQHRQIVICLLKCMNRELKRNICQIDRFTLNQDIEDLPNRVAKHVSAGLSCACHNWAYHLKCTTTPEDDGSDLGELLRVFAQEKMLNWIEVLSLLGALPSAVSALENASSWSFTALPRMQSLTELFRDGHRVVLHLAQGITECASQIYEAIPFLPTKTLLRSVYQRECDGSIKVLTGMEDRWNACLRTVDNDGAVTSVEFSPDGTTIAASSTRQSLGIIRLWNAKTGEPVTQTEAGGDGWPWFAFLPNGSLVFGAFDGTLSVWDIESSEVTHTHRAHSDPIKSVAASPTGSHVASGWDDRLLIWNTSTWEYEEFGGACKFVAISCRDVVAAIIHPSDDDLDIGIWDLRTQQPKTQMTGHTSSVQTIKFSPDGRKLVSGAADATVRIWDVESGEQRAVFGSLPGWALSVAFSPDGLYVAGSDNAVRIWDVDTGVLRSLLKGHQAQVNGLSFSPNGKLLASGSSDDTLKIWDWHDALSGEKEEGHSEWIQTMAISPDGNTLVTGSWDATIAMWDSNDGRLIKLWKAHERSVLSIAFSPDGTIFASAGGEVIVKFWNSVTGELERTLLGHPDKDGSSESGESTYPSGWSGALAFSADGAQLALETDQNLIIWSLDTGEDKEIWAEEGPYPYSLAFSADGRRLASGHEDYIYELDLDMPQDEEDRFTYFDVDGVARQIAFGDGDGYIVSSVGVIQLQEDQEVPGGLKTLHLSRGWLVDSEGTRLCWVPEAYRGKDVHVSLGPTRVILGGTNGRPLIVDLITPQDQV